MPNNNQPARCDKPGTVWYVVVHPESGYPQLVYADKERAKTVAESNKQTFVAVTVTPGVIQ